MTLQSHFKHLPAQIGRPLGQGKVAGLRLGHDPGSCPVHDVVDAFGRRAGVREAVVGRLVCFAA